MKIRSMKNKSIKKSNKSLLKTKISKKVKRKLSQRNPSQHKPSQRKLSQHKPSQRKLSQRKPSKKVQRKTQRMYLKKGGGCCCGKNNFSTGAPYNPNEWGTPYNRIQTYYPFNNEVINPPMPANQTGGSISGIKNIARGIVENAKSGWNTFNGVQSPYSSYVSPVIQPALEYENNNYFNQSIPVPVDIKMIHDGVGSMV